MDGKGGKCIHINQLAKPSIEDERMEVFFSPSQRVEHLAGKRIGFKQKQANFPNGLGYQVGSRRLASPGNHFMDRNIQLSLLNEKVEIPTLGRTGAAGKWRFVEQGCAATRNQTNKRFADYAERLAVAEENFDKAAYKAFLVKRKTHGLNTLQKHVIELLKGMRRVTLRSTSRSVTPSFTLKAKS